jgi:hypothetical protein
MITRNVVAAILAGVLVGSSAFAEELEVPFHRQNTMVWCWAAAIAMVGGYATNTNAEDCQVLAAYDRLLNGPGACCQVPGKCLRAGGTQEMATILANIYHLRGYHHVRALSFRELKNEIDRGRPMIAALQTGFSGHVVVISGYEDPDVVVVLDPMSGRHEVTYSQLRANFQTGYWTETFTIRGRSADRGPVGEGQRAEPPPTLFCCDAWGRRRCQITVNPGPVGSPCWCAGIPGQGVICR